MHCNWAILKRNIQPNIKYHKICAKQKKTLLCEILVRFVLFLHQRKGNVLRNVVSLTCYKFIPVANLFGFHELAIVTVKPSDDRNLP